MDHRRVRVEDALRRDDDGLVTKPGLATLGHTQVKVDDVTEVGIEPSDLLGGEAPRRAPRTRNGGLVDELKTDASYRTIALPAPALDELRRQRRIAAELRLASRTWVVDDPGLVFPTINGGPWNPVNARAELARICSDNGLPVVRPNELRHSCATVLSERGVPLERIADLLGHTSTRMLDMTYRHRPRLAVDAAVDVMDRLFGS